MLKNKNIEIEIKEDSWEVSGYLLKQVERFMGVKIIDKDMRKSQFYLSNGESIGIYGRTKMVDKKTATESWIGVNEDVVNEATSIILRIDDYDITALLPSKIFKENEFLKSDKRYLVTYVYNENNDEHSLRLKKQNDGINLLDIDRFIVDLPFIEI